MVWVLIGKGEFFPPYSVCSTYSRYKSFLPKYSCFQIKWVSYNSNYFRLKIKLIISRQVMFFAVGRHLFTEFVYFRFESNLYQFHSLRLVVQYIQNNIACSTLIRFGHIIGIRSKRSSGLNETIWFESTLIIITTWCLDWKP